MRHDIQGKTRVNSTQTLGIGSVNVYECSVQKFIREKIGRMFEERMMDALALNKTKMKWKSEEFVGMIGRRSGVVRGRTREGMTLMVSLEMQYLNERRFYPNPKLEYAAVIWSPHKKDIKKLEGIQRAATNRVPSLRNLPYEERLSRLKLPALEKRRKRKNFMAMYRASKGLGKIDREDVCVGRQKYKRTREETEKDYMQERYKKYNFPYRSIDVWNKLDAEVINARNIHDFKSKLDNNKFKEGTIRA